MNHKYMPRLLKIAILSLFLLPLLSGCSSNVFNKSAAPSAPAGKQPVATTPVIPDCSCADAAKNCCADCALGSRCGGGFLFATSSAGSLIAAPGGCQTNNCVKDEAGNPCFNSVLKTASTTCSGLDNAWEEKLTWTTAEAADAATYSTSTGQTNTSIAAGSATPHPAAAYCDQLDTNGFDDWYLPARDEWEQLFKASNFCQFAKKTDCAKLIGNPLADLNGGLYWSSTGDTGKNAWGINASNGDSQVYQGTLPATVRCIRRF
jgi:hypothetical protein